MSNPYETPTNQIAETNSSPGSLAGRGTRLVAAIIDGLIIFAATVPIMLLMGTWSYYKLGQKPPMGLLLASIALNFVAFILIQGYFLKTNGQTIGKKVMGIRIATMTLDVPAFGTLLGLRYLPVSLIGLVPFVGQILPLVDVLFIFRNDRRCIHDLIAGTQVVTA